MRKSDDVTIAQFLMMRTEMVHETAVILNQLTWLIAQEDFINECLEVCYNEGQCDSSIFGL
jgi:hypothetical protein